MNAFIRAGIDNKVSDRIGRTERTAEQLYSYRNDSKDKLIKNNESQFCFLYNMKDSTLQRARERSLKNELVIEKNIDKFINQENPEKTKYYERCVK
jgi:hypothetical protein